MIIIMEGADNTGKSEIGKALSKELLIPYFKNSQESKFFNICDFTHYRFLDQYYISDFLKQTKYSAIFDRAYPSDIVYTNVFRKDLLDIMPNLFDIDEKFSLLGAAIIYCEKDVQLEEDELVNTEFYDAIISEYEKFLEATKCKYLKLNTTDCNLACQLGTITKFLGV